MYFVAARMITYWRGESHLSLYSIRHHTVYALLFFMLGVSLDMFGVNAGLSLTPARCW